MILIPPAMLDWDAAALRAVLFHELAHIRRYDLAGNLLATFATALFWFHPLCWKLAARMRHEQECACDDYALTQGIESQAYAGLIVASATPHTPGALAGCAMAGRPGVQSLKNRLSRVLDSTRVRSTSALVLTRITSLFAAAALALALMHPSFGEEVKKVGGRVTAPHVISKVQPKYTPEAKAAHIEGTVVLQVVIGSDGNPHDIRVIKGLDEGLERSAMAAVSEWRFEPAKEDGKPVAVESKIEINFTLLKEPPADTH